MADYIVLDTSVSTNYLIVTGSFAGSGPAPAGTITDGDDLDGTFTTAEGLTGTFPSAGIADTPMRYLGTVTVNGEAYPVFEFTLYGMMTVFGIELPLGTFPTFSTLPALDVSDFNIDGETDPPVTVDDFVSTDRDVALTIDVLDNDSDPDGGILKLEEVTGASYGSVEIENNQVIYTPGPGATGIDQMQYTVSDGQGGQSTGYLNVTINLVAARPEDMEHSFAPDIKPLAHRTPLTSGNDLADFSGASQALIVAGRHGDDSIKGSGFDDLLMGNKGTDHLQGGAGNDLLRGGKGDDWLYGDAGSDILSGDFGADHLTGGTGRDSFAFKAKFATGADVDTVTDFTFGDDIIALIGIDIASVSFEQAGGATHMSVDGNLVAEFQDALANEVAQSAYEDPYSI